MRTIDAQDLFHRIVEARDKYDADSTDLVERAIRVGLDRALTEIVLSPTVEPKH